MLLTERDVTTQLKYAQLVGSVFALAVCKKNEIAAYEEVRETEEIRDNVLNTLGLAKTPIAYIEKTEASIEAKISTLRAIAQARTECFNFLLTTNFQPTTTHTDQATLDTLGGVYVDLEVIRRQWESVQKSIVCD